MRRRGPACSDVPTIAGSMRDRQQVSGRATVAVTDYRIPISGEHASYDRTHLALASLSGDSDRRARRGLGTLSVCLGAASLVQREFGFPRREVHSLAAVSTDAGELAVGM